MGPVSAEETFVPDTFALDGVTLTGIAISPDGSRVYFETDGGQVRVLDASRHEEVPGFSLPQAWYYSPRISPDGSHMAITSDNFGLTMRDVTTGKEIWDFNPHLQISSRAFSADGQRVSTSLADGSVSVLDAATGGQIRNLAPGGDDLVMFAKLNGDGSRVLAVTRRSLSVWDLASGAEWPRVSLEANINDASFRPDGTRIVLAGDDGLV